MLITELSKTHLFILEPLLHIGAVNSYSCERLFHLIKQPSLKNHSTTHSTHRLLLLRDPIGTDARRTGTTRRHVDLLVFFALNSPFSLFMRLFHSFIRLFRSLFAYFALHSQLLSSSVPRSFHVVVDLRMRTTEL